MISPKNKKIICILVRRYYRLPSEETTNLVWLEMRRVDMPDAIRQEGPEDVGYAIHSIPRPQSDWLLSSSPPHLG